MKNMRIDAFTLAEVMITLGIIGVVASIILPAIITSINERINSERQVNIVQKITKAMEQMRANGLLSSQYSSTESFADELQRNIKILKRCDSEHIADCWPVATIKTGEGKEFNISNAKIGKNIGLNTKTNNVGFVLSDGASIILNYDPNVSGIDIGDEVSAYNKLLPVGNNNKKDFPYSTSVTSSIDFLMDVNGKKNPNSETIGSKYNDIRSFRAARFSSECVGGEEYNGKCVLFLGTSYDYIDCSEGNSDNELYQKYCGPSPSGYQKDYWAGAKYACEKIDMKLPEIDEITKICSANRKSKTITLSGWVQSATEHNSTRPERINSNNCLGDSTNSKGSRNNVLCVAK